MSVYEFLFGSKTKEVNKEEENEAEVRSSEESMLDFINKSKAFGSKGMPHKNKVKKEK